MAKTIKEERLRWVLPIIRKEIKLVVAAKVCPYGMRSIERWVAAYKRGGGAAPLTISSFSLPAGRQVWRHPIQKFARRISKE